MVILRAVQTHSEWSLNSYYLIHNVIRYPLAEQVGGCLMPPGHQAIFPYTEFVDAPINPPFVDQQPFQEPRLEVPTIYKAQVGEYPSK